MLKFKDNYLLKNVTTLQLGGPAKKFVKVNTEEELIEAIKYAKEDKIPYLIIGGGSNILVSDEGIECLVIKNEITGISTREESKPTSQVSVSAKSGTPLQELVDFAIKNGLSGLQKLTGIPGTVGGAIYGNAGAYGQAISDFLIEVLVFDGERIVNYSKNECGFNYRDSAFKKNGFTILEAKFQLQKADAKTLQKEANEVLAKRLIKYPPGLKCPGSFFKNIIANTLPKPILDKIPTEKIMYGKVPAGALLETVGAKGQRLDGIRIADYHANLFINDDGSAKDFYKLAKIYALKVKEKFNITLDPEVQLINLPPLI